MDKDICLTSGNKPYLVFRESGSVSELSWKTLQPQWHLVIHVLLRGSPWRVDGAEMHRVLTTCSRATLGSCVMDFIEK